MTRAEEMKAIVAGYLRNLKYLEGEIAAMDTGPLTADALKETEDAVSLFLNGGQCVKHTHEGATKLAKLLMLKQLRLDMPHVSTALANLELEIRRESKGKP